MSGDKRAPVQGYSPGIPWSMHVRAYDAYAKRWGAQPALLDLEGRNCRGGFGTEELDEFIPGWRDELSELTQLRLKLAAAEADRDEFRDLLHDLVMLDGEESAIGGGPGFKERRDKAWAAAREKFEP